ncbi:MAG: alanine dehydrogenase, partial [Solirubrobacteraceae bacterium]
MKVGVPRETKADEYRISMTPAGVRELREHHHDVLVEAGAGIASGFSDEQFTGQGAEIVADAESLFADADMVVKVKEPLDFEVARLRPGQILFTYLHLAPTPELTRALCASGA